MKANCTHIYTHTRFNCPNMSECKMKEKQQPNSDQTKQQEKGKTVI